jgi:hypothetical protein
MCATIHVYEAGQPGVVMAHVVVEIVLVQQK